MIFLLWLQILTFIYKITNKNCKPHSHECQSSIYLLEKLKTCSQNMQNLKGIVHPKMVRTSKSWPFLFSCALSLSKNIFDVTCGVPQGLVLGPNLFVYCLCQTERGIRFTCLEVGLSCSLLRRCDARLKVLLVLVAADRWWSTVAVILLYNQLNWE